MKLHVTLFLIKEGFTAVDALVLKGRRNHVSFVINGVDCDFYWKTHTSTPKWVELFSILDGVNTRYMTGKSLQGLLVFQQHGRLFCFTFGHARHLINPLAIERNFGLKAALSLSDPDLIKSIDKSNIDITPFRSRTQSSKYVPISEFEFKFDWEILKSLTGIIESDPTEDYEVVSGADSVSLYTEISLHSLPATASRLFKAYQDNKYKEKYPWIDYIMPVRDKQVISLMDELVIKKINDNNFNEIWAAPPTLVPYENFSGFCYKLRSTGKSSQTTHPDLDLQNCLDEKNIIGELTVPKAKSTKIFLLDGNYQEVDAWSLYICLNAEIEHDGNTYLLSEGSWYQIDKNFVAQIETYFSKYPHSDIKFPAYNGMHEGPYLESISDGKNFYLLDRKLIYLTGTSSGFEFCDLLTPNNELIHVKKYSSSSGLSHLFSQAYVSAESLLRSSEVVRQVNNYLAESTSHTLQFDSSTQPREATIVLAIMQKSHGKLHMPFFSKVNFRQYSQQLTNMGFKVQLKKIEH
ncbi:MAG: TIGR04141 family sporadically distributed protein [Candidatus Poribacteria bacterium]|nr:TIGR04141 family sporadically distributed protein [Candidatus Poribacteria bacterium]